MSMEAQMEATMIMEQNGRLQKFGVSMPDTGAVKLIEDKAEDLFSYMHFVSFSFLLKSGAIVSSFLGQLSPLGVVLRMKQAKSTMQYPPFTFVCVFCCGLQWCVYGTFAFVVTRNHGFLILVYANACGVIMGAYYVCQYYSNCVDVTRMRQLKTCAYAAVINGVFQSLVISDVAHTRALLIVGTISACLSVLVTAAPLAELPLILKTGDVSSLPKEFVCCQFVCSALWFGCGLLLHDTWILVPNVFGLVLGGFQLYLLFAFGDLARVLKGALAKPMLEKGTKGMPFLADPSYGTLVDDVEPRASTGGTD